MLQLLCRSVFLLTFRDQCFLYVCVCCCRHSTDSVLYAPGTLCCCFLPLFVCSKRNLGHPFKEVKFQHPALQHELQHKTLLLEILRPSITETSLTMFSAKNVDTHPLVGEGLIKRRPCWSNRAAQFIDTMISQQSPGSNIVLFVLAVCCSGGEKAGAQAAVFRSRIWDVSQKSLYLQNNELVAGYLQGPNSALEEKIYWVHNHAFGREKFPVILSIQDGKRCLTCSSSSVGPSPHLQLETINITDFLEDSREESARFTFFLSNQGGIWRFESAAHPGWFLCTSSRTNEPVSLTQKLGPSHVVDFYFQPC
uniref:Interleukin-1 n=1 Tax=Pogona vitticeps TaxID=103695 RepID=A0A6J0SPJ9_9SAUR